MVDTQRSAPHLKLAIMEPLVSLLPVLVCLGLLRAVLVLFKIQSIVPRSLDRLANNAPSKINFFPFAHLDLAVFSAIFFGCATYCSPFAVPSRFALVVAAYSLGLNDSLAAFGR